MMQCRVAKLWPPSHRLHNSTSAAHGLGPAAPLASWESPPACTGQAITHSSKGFPSVQKFRDPFELGAPSAGGLSLATNGTPILGVGQRGLTDRPARQRSIQPCGCVQRGRRCVDHSG